jgi:hypothetical protein
MTYTLSYTLSCDGNTELEPEKPLTDSYARYSDLLSRYSETTANYPTEFGHQILNYDFNYRGNLEAPRLVSNEKFRPPPKTEFKNFKHKSIGDSVNFVVKVKWDRFDPTGELELTLYCLDSGSLEFKAEFFDPSWPQYKFPFSLPDKVRDHFWGALRGAGVDKVYESEGKDLIFKLKYDPSSKSWKKKITNQPSGASGALDIVTYQLTVKHY